jgi:hypothetical protein
MAGFDRRGETRDNNNKKLKHSLFMIPLHLYLRLHAAALAASGAYLLHYVPM